MEMKRGVSKKREGTTGIRFVTLCGKRFLTQQDQGQSPFAENIPFDQDLPEGNFTGFMLLQRMA